MRISDWSSDVCSSDLNLHRFIRIKGLPILRPAPAPVDARRRNSGVPETERGAEAPRRDGRIAAFDQAAARAAIALANDIVLPVPPRSGVSESLASSVARSDEHTSELQSLMRNSYAVFCLKK